MTEIIEKLYTTELGAMRIKRNLKITEPETDVVEYCKHKTPDKTAKFYRQGKNWYCESDCENGTVRITVNAYSFTIITAHLWKSYLEGVGTDTDKPTTDKSYDDFVRFCSVDGVEPSPGDYFEVDLIGQGLVSKSNGFTLAMNAFANAIGEDVKKPKRAKKAFDYLGKFDDTDFPWGKVAGELVKAGVITKDEVPKLRGALDKYKVFKNAETGEVTKAKMKASEY